MAKAKSGSVVSGDYDYKSTRIRDKDGALRHTRSNDDAVARAMLVATASGVTIEQIIKANDLGSKFKPSQWDNRGLLRMSVGNTLRGLVRNDTPVKIGSVTVKSLEQRVAVPEVKDAPKKAAKPKAKKVKAKRAKKVPASAEASPA